MQMHSSGDQSKKRLVDQISTFSFAFALRSKVCITQPTPPPSLRRHQFFFLSFASEAVPFFLFFFSTSPAIFIRMVQLSIICPTMPLLLFLHIFYIQII